jgi:hypothetical protein
MGIKIQSLQWRSDGETEAKTYGNATLPGARTVEDTRKYIDELSQRRVPRGLFPFLSPRNLLILLQSEAGCRIVVNALLIHVASNLETHSSGVVIAPKCRVEDKPLGSTKHSFNALADYMLFYGDKIMRGQCVSPLSDPVSNYTYADRIEKSKAFAFSDPEIYKLVKCIIYKAKSKDFSAPQRLFLKRRWPLSSRRRACSTFLFNMSTILRTCPFRLKTFRGCVTSGKHWIFFVYNAENPEHGQGKTVYWLEPRLNTAMTITYAFSSTRCDLLFSYFENFP